MKRRNVLEGTYIKPEFFLGAESSWVRTGDGLEIKRTANVSTGLMLNLGTQWTIGDSFLIDTYIGGGIGTGKSNRGYLIGENGLVMNAGVNFGFSF